MKAIQRLLEECSKAGCDIFGFIHFIPKEIYDDAQREFDEYRKHERRVQKEV
jgi:hypothetical protein